MSVLATAMVFLHNLFAMLWVGTVLFFSYAVLSSGRGGALGREPLEDLLGGLTTVTRVSALVLLLSGILMGLNLYTVDRLLGTTDGWLVIGKVVLWVALAGAVEAGAGKLESELDGGQVSDSVEATATLFYVASAIAVLSALFVALLATGVPLQ
ncbi:putative membrane protein [Halalkaliarchaeum sp. AArc-CO]|uniref:transporter n=1 Tax=unclassified Halalkaliarchaeum TaxID=2678344 RepID=UPI00217D494B|nr:MULTISPECIES: transporter [unclassified Halalkaliarchaeum]MDR5673253.1 transporter [Halalkaliarchaeum sp. AArc-GB]UWG51787.1 putative membrane protein [Halalkaliarchaeum sp. AArc-CO]